MNLLGQRLYLRIWLAVVAAGAVLTLAVGWLWQAALDHERQQNDSRAGREIVLRNSAGEVVGQAPARAVRVPGEALEFQVTMNDGQTLYESPTYQITHIVDRVGGGDSFMGGLIYGLLRWPEDDQRALDFAVAASCLKHTIYGDANLVTVAEVESLMGGDGSGRVSR